MTTPDRPQRPTNRPGLPTLAYRIGDYTAFFQRMLKRLPTELSPPDDPGQGGPLAKLTTRALNDPAIALLDAWAVVADVLTFYQERIANEGYLLTATERRSVLELARMIGYELGPGVSASTELAFFVDDDPKEPGVALVPQGTQVMSVPVGDEKPQIFETSEAFIARALWNALKPRPSKPQAIEPGTQDIYVTGDVPDLRSGDRLLLIEDRDDSNRRYLLTIERTAEVPESDNIRITLKSALSLAKPLRNPKLIAFRQQAHLFGYNAPRWQDMPDEIKRTAVEAYLEDDGSVPSADGNSELLIEGGVLSSENNGETWMPVGKDLPNKDILCLGKGINNDVLFAGTAGQGIVRFKPDDQRWEAVNTGLTNLNIQTFYTDSSLKHLYVGTPGGGVFRSKDEGENWTPINTGSVRVESRGDDNWQSINTGLPNTVVRALVTFETPIRQGVGTLAAGQGIEITGNGTNFSVLSIGDTITVDSQTRSIIRIQDDTQLYIDSAFSIAIPGSSNFRIGGNYIFAG
ncbi:MAG: hypothetical protein F6J97_16885, partial [Leptolyngbya sp. SIO4C1]|nr:hypothetical protein [Leptolyngbya sp. SIO4C1]